MILEESNLRIPKVRRKDMRRSKVPSDEIRKSVSAGKGWGTMWRGEVGILLRPSFKVRDRREGKGANDVEHGARDIIPVTCQGKLCETIGITDDERLDSGGICVDHEETALDLKSFKAGCGGREYRDDGFAN